MSANERQVGGDHYRSQLQHWDMIEDYGIGYLEACATKYVTRWRRKDGVEGLEKGAHYLEKLLERSRGPRGSVPNGIVDFYSSCNVLTLQESQIVRLIVRWRETYHINRALFMLRQMIDDPKKNWGWMVGDPVRDRAGNVGRIILREGDFVRVNLSDGSVVRRNGSELVWNV